MDISMADVSFIEEGSAPGTRQHLILKEQLRTSTLGRRFIYLPQPGVDPISIDAGQAEAEMTCDQSRRR
jgi:hypothetical protein